MRTEQERLKAVDEMKERLLKGFLLDLQAHVFVKSTNSVTGEVEILPSVVEDMEAIIKINGEWDREDLKNILSARAG